MPDTGVRDYGVHDLDDNTGTGDVTDESSRSGDSAVVFGCKLPSLTKHLPPTASGNSPETYKELDQSTMNVVHPLYSSLTDAPKKRTKSKESVEINRL